MHLFRNKYLIILLICLLFGGIFEIFYLQLPDFDFYSYHYVNAWSFLNNRIGLDFMTNQARSYYNPLLDCIDYLVIQKLNYHPYVFLFVSGFKYGVFLFLTFLISEFAFIRNGIVKKTGIISVLFLTILSPIVIFCTRIGSNDLQIANMILISVYLQIRYLFKKNHFKRFLFLLLSAFVMGCAIGLKNTAFVFAIPMVISTLIYLKKDSFYFKTIFLMLVSAISGFLLCDGWWIYTIWKLYGNPIFPYSNYIFKSNMADISNYTYTEYEHLHRYPWWEYLYAPLKDTLSNLYLGFERYYFEPKMNLSFYSVAILLIFYHFESFKNKLTKYVKPEILFIFVIYIILSYYINSYIFGTLRYVIVLAPLCSIIIVSLALLYSKKLKNKAIYPLLIFVLIWSFYTFSFNQFKFITPFNLNSVIVNEKADILDNSIVFCGNQTSCFVAPTQNKNITYIAFAVPKHIQESNKLYVTTHTPYRNYYYTSNYLENRIKNIFKTNKPIYILFNCYYFVKDKKIYNTSLKYYTEEQIHKLNNCKQVHSKVLGFRIPVVICRIK